MQNSKHIEVAILLATKNRFDYLVRQLRYYAKIKSPHPIYVGDSSDADQSKKITQEIEKLKSSLKIHYNRVPEKNYCETTIMLLSQTKEKYICMIGDDDYQIPASLTICANFLEHNPDYASAHGHSVAIRIKDNGVYGKITKIKDYPQPFYDSDSAKERAIAFFNKYYVSHFSVVRADVMKKSWMKWHETPMRGFSDEVLDCSLIVIMGKSKLLDCLGFIRQIHDQHYEQPSYFDWITNQAWNNSYQNFERILSEEISTRDKIEITQARAAIRSGFWNFLQQQLAREYNEYFPSHTMKRKKLKTKIIEMFPMLNPIYKKIKPLISKKRYLHAEVLNPKSPYYSNFQQIVDSCSEKKL